MIEVYKDEVCRNIADKDLEKYLAAGWTAQAQSAPKGKKVLVDEPVVLTPTIEANAIVKPESGDANDEEN